MLTIYLIVAIVICLIVPPLRLLSIALMLLLLYANLWAFLGLAAVFVLLYTFFPPTTGS